MSIDDYTPKSDPVNPPQFNHVLDDVIRSLSFGQVYELERGLFLSEFDRKQLCHYLLDELSRRREESRKSAADAESSAAPAPKDGPRKGKWGGLVDEKDRAIICSVEGCHRQADKIIDNIPYCHEHEPKDGEAK